MTKPRGLTARERQLVEHAAETSAAKGVKSALITLGIDADNPLEVQKDFAHLRRSRVGSQEVRKVARRAAIVACITAGVYAAWAVAKDWLMRHVS